MSILFRFFVIGLLTLWAVSPAFAQQSATLIYSANLDGELEPCGCAESGNYGGIMRRVTTIDELRKTSPDLFLISAGGLIVNEAPQDKIKSEYIFKGYAALNYDAIGLQHNDLAFGNQFSQAQKLPWTINNSHLDGAPSFRDIQKGQTSLRFFQWLSASEHSNDMGQQFKPNNESAALKKLQMQLDEARQQGKLTLLATTLKLDTAKKLFPLDKIDLLIIKANYEEYGEAKKVGNTIVLQPGSRGMRLGRLDLKIAAGAITDFTHSVIDMPKEIADAPRMSNWYADYNTAVTDLYKQRIAASKNLKEEDKLYAGEAACKNCHQKEHEIWFNTKHAEAYYQLMDVDKGYDPDCVGCHVLGLDKPGGFLDPMLTENMMHVQCENCHGAAKQHVASRGEINTSNANWPKEKICGQCHVQKHSPEFNFKQYWPRIQHGK